MNKIQSLQQESMLSGVSRECEKAPNAEFTMFMLVTQMKAAWFEGTPVWTVLHISKVCWNIANVAAPLDRTLDYD